jgi:hypothetical protein
MHSPLLNPSPMPALIRCANNLPHNDGAPHYLLPLPSTHTPLYTPTFPASMACSVASAA